MHICCSNVTMQNIMYKKNKETNGQQANSTRFFPNKCNSTIRWCSVLIYASVALICGPAIPNRMRNVYTGPVFPHIQWYSMTSIPWRKSVQFLGVDWTIVWPWTSSPLNWENGFIFFLRRLLSDFGWFPDHENCKNQFSASGYLSLPRRCDLIVRNSTEWDEIEFNQCQPFSMSWSYIPDHQDLEFCLSGQVVLSLGWVGRWSAVEMTVEAPTLPCHESVGPRRWFGQAKSYLVGLNTRGS